MLLSRIRILSLHLQLCHSFIDPAPQVAHRSSAPRQPAIRRNLFFGGAFVYSNPTQQGIAVNANNPQAVIIGVVLLVAVIGAIFLIARERRRAQSRHLQQRFGPEYSRVVSTVGDREKAEAELQARERRVERLHLVALPAAEASRFAQEWEALQTRFVDNPTGVVGEADRVVRELMLKRGYPMADFEHRAADISVHHPLVVDNYRAAQAIAARNVRGQASTEDLRKAVVHYRALFEDLLEVGGTRKAETRTVTERKTEAVQP
jgi:hypothetical protein